MQKSDFRFFLKATYLHFYVQTVKVKPKAISYEKLVNAVSHC